MSVAGKSRKGDSVLSIPSKSCLGALKTATECVGGHTTGIQTLAKHSASNTSRLKPELTKRLVIPKKKTELLAKNNELLVNDKQDQRQSEKIEKSKHSTVKLTKKVPEEKLNKSTIKYKDMSDIADLILKNRCRKIIVITGAGISTPSGIPDFRTPGSGLYDNLKKYNLPYPEAIFEIDYFTYNPRPFFALAKELYPGKYKPNIVHYFVKLLYDKGLLLRCYTQNIDGLERLAGIPPTKLVEAHGTFSSASCHLCYSPFPANEAKDCIMNGRSPRCKTCYGVVKPDIVFFGEDLPKRFRKFTKDFPRADLLIIMGTSLKIEPFAKIVDAVQPNVPRLLLNRDLVGPFKTKHPKSTDVAALGELCDLTRRFVRSLHWQDEMKGILKSQKSKGGS
ncbi:NAD-dependent protein deacetylase sirtuin-3-like isoform X2 [Pelobates fuscus]|uniref:NAD-dependent protein deacetylase sirtuin-3-like isoform X2 n=1 Tax=Pelobates fuscus TaxID=191477 RepID=UPI002FE442EF